jgi:hypothetical protein
LSQKAVHRAFRSLLRRKVRWHLPASNQTPRAYDAYFASVRRSILLRWLFSRMRLPFPASYEEHALAITAQIFNKYGVPLFYLPVEWDGEPPSVEKHLRQPALFLSRHSKFALGAMAITGLGGEVATIAARPHTQARRFERSGILHADRIAILPRDRMALLSLRKEMALGKHGSCFVDCIDPASGQAMIDEGLFRFAGICGHPVYFLRFGVNGRGRICGMICGPVDCSDVIAAIERFNAFTGASLPVLSR